MLRFKRAGLIGAAVAFFCGLILHGAFGEFGLELIQRSYDYPFGPRPPIPVNEVVMVYLDEESHKELNQPFNAPWDRSVHARLLERLTADGARAVVFDIVFSDAGPNPVADEYFAEQFARMARLSWPPTQSPGNNPSKPKPSSHPILHCVKPPPQWVPLNLFLTRI